MANDRAKAAQRRQSDAGRLKRKMYNSQPQVKAHKSAVYKIKKNLGLIRRSY